MDVELKDVISENFKIGMTVKNEIHVEQKVSIIHKEYRTEDGSQRYQVRPLNGIKLTTISPSSI